MARYPEPSDGREYAIKADGKEGDNLRVMVVKK
jgi:hypothetical protein